MGKTVVTIVVSIMVILGLGSVSQAKILQESKDAKVRSIKITADERNVTEAGTTYTDFCYVEFEIYDVSGNLLGTTKKQYAVSDAEASAQGISNAMDNFKNKYAELKQNIVTVINDYKN